VWVFCRSRRWRPWRLACVWFRLVSSCRFQGHARARSRKTAWLSQTSPTVALPCQATVSKRRFCRLRRQHNLPICRDFYGSDGTRTRDLRRDRPSRAQRRLATSSSERPHLQVLFGPSSPLLRMVEPIVESTFGPRVGHETLSGVTTQDTRHPTATSPRLGTSGTASSSENRNGSGRPQAPVGGRPGPAVGNGFRQGRSGSALAACPMQIPCTTPLSIADRKWMPP
jgi:hypothetical protein